MKILETVRDGNRFRLTAYLVTKLRKADRGSVSAMRARGRRTCAVKLPILRIRIACAVEKIKCYFCRLSRTGTDSVSKTSKIGSRKRTVTGVLDRSLRARTWPEIFLNVISPINIFNRICVNFLGVNGSTSRKT